MRGEIFGFFLKFKAALFLFFILLFGFVLLSGFRAFIPVSLLSIFGFSIRQPWALLSYWLTHTGLFHLAVNAVSVFAFAAILERTLSARGVLKIFFFSAFLSAFFFSLLNPDILLIGASAGMSGLLACSLVLKPKQSLIALAAILAFLLLLFPLISFALEEQKTSLQSETSILSSDLNKAVAEKNFQKAKELSKQLAEKNTQSSEFNLALKLSATTKTDSLIHALGAFFGLAYLAVFRKQSLKDAFRKIKKRKPKKR